MTYHRVDRSRSRHVRIRQLALGIGLLLSSSASAEERPPAGLSGGMVRIGIINDQSGPLSDNSGPGAVVAARMAVEDFHRTMPGMKVEIVTADHQNKPDIGAQIVRKWFDVDGVDMVADVGNSAVALAIQSIARDKNKIVIYSAVGTTDIGGKQCSPTGLIWLHDYYSLVNGSVGRLVAQGHDSWIFITNDYTFGRNMVEVSQKVLATTNTKTKKTEKQPQKKTENNTNQLQAQASKAKVIAFANAGEQLVTSMKLWTEFGMSTGGQKAVAELMFLTDVHAMGAEMAQGLTTVTAWYWGLTDETRAFGQRFYQLHKAMPTAPQAAVYSAVLHYLRAVAASGTDETNAVLDKLRATPVEDI